MRAVILAGGQGTRLRPYTTILPKPLMPVGQKAIVEVIIDQLKHHGFNHITLALGHLAHLVKAVLGNGDRFQVSVDYSIEEIPLGTSGPLGLIKNLDGTFLVMNGDVLSNIDFNDVLRFHREQHAIATIAVHKMVVKIDYGVLNRAGYSLLNYQEKPSLDYEVSTGIYVLESSVLRYIIPFSHLDFPDLVRQLMGNGEKVACYPFTGIWYDLGRTEDFRYVQDHMHKFREAIPFLS
jgi:NDP-sugar pyrophosphorylase family protein